MPARPNQIRPIIAHDEEDSDLIKGSNWGLTNGYPSRRRNGDTEYLHVLIAGSKPGHEVDHVNRNKLDARRKNLRLVPHAVNAQNMSISSVNKSGFRGVSLCKRSGTWKAYVHINGKQFFLGRFQTPEDANTAAKDFRKQNMKGATD